MRLQQVGVRNHHRICDFRGGGDDRCAGLPGHGGGDEPAVGVNDDDVVCELCAMPISAIDHGTERIGFEAAALLERLMRGEAAPPGPVLVSPRAVVPRQSTDALAIEDADVAEAVRFIRRHAHDGISVSDVLEQVTVCRRTLEDRFRGTIGRTKFSSIFKRVTGLSPRAYRASRRIR